jgi:hypothetical protein
VLQRIENRTVTTLAEVDDTLEHCEMIMPDRLVPAPARVSGPVRSASQVEAEAASRRRRAMRLRSRSDVPPHTPWSMWLAMAYSRQGDFTGQSAQIRRATSTPTPSLGKKRSGG